MEMINRTTDREISYCTLYTVELGGSAWSEGRGGGRWIGFC